jgi:hypothetical protein
VTTKLRPFWRYFGAKWRAVSQGRYPQPLRDTIVEPFAGAAGYALHWPERNVILVERYHVVAEIWRWLIGASATEVRSVPLVDDVDDLPSTVAQGARWLVGFSMNAATTTPRKAISRSARLLRDSGGRKFYGWTDALRERVAMQVDRIRHWQIIEDDYTAAPDVEATWFVDPPYQTPGHSYPHGPASINYAKLADWCRARRGQPIVCEQPGAGWLPFRRMPPAKSGPRTQLAEEAVWP